MEHRKQKTPKMKRLPSPASTPDGNLAFARAIPCARASVSDFNMKQSKQKETTKAILADLIGRSRPYSRSLDLQTQSSEVTVRVP